MFRVKLSHETRTVLHKRACVERSPLTGCAPAGVHPETAIRARAAASAARAGRTFRRALAAPRAGSVTCACSAGSRCATAVLPRAATARRSPGGAVSRSRRSGPRFRRAPGVRQSLDAPSTERPRCAVLARTERAFLSPRPAAPASVVLSRELVQAEHTAHGVDQLRLRHGELGRRRTRTRLRLKRALVLVERADERAPWWSELAA